MGWRKTVSNKRLSVNAEVAWLFVEVIMVAVVVVTNYLVASEATVDSHNK